MLRCALRAGGYPEARRRLKGRSARAIEGRARRLDVTPLEVPGIRVAGSAEVQITLRVSDRGARSLIHSDPLHLRRGRFLGMLPCRLQALKATRDPDIALVKTDATLSAKEAAERLQITVSAFRDTYAPRLSAVRLPVRGECGQRLYLYPVDAVADLARQRRAS